MKIPNLSFVLGFRRLSRTLIANEPFTLPEPYEPVLEELRKIAPYIELSGPELRIECSADGELSWSGLYYYVQGDQERQDHWDFTLKQSARLGASVLAEATQTLEQKSMKALLQGAVNDYLTHCSFPQPERIVTDEQGVDSLAELAVCRHRLAMENLDTKLILPRLNFLPFPSTVARLMREEAQAQVEEEADAWLQTRAGAGHDPQ